MTSLKGRFLVAFLAVVTVLIIAGLALFTAQLRVTEQYKSVSDTMIAEYRLVDTCATLIKAFNDHVKSAGTGGEESAEKIRVAEAQIQGLMQLLDKNITDIESRSNYIGFKASVETLTKQIDAGTARFEQGSIKDYISDYAGADKDYGFVRDNGTALIFSQLKYTSSLRDAINRTYMMTIYIGFVSLFVLVLGCVFVVLRFADRLSSPLRTLTRAAKQISDGNMDFIIGPTLLAQSDEIGMLARSFAAMERNLRDKIAQLDASNKETKKNADVAIAENSELERLNKLMIDRELKMIELKKRIVELESRETPPSSLG